MRQISAALVGAIVIWIAFSSCDKPRAAISVRHPTVASLVPAASEMIVGMGCRDHLVAVSNFDGANPEVRELPRVGDYQSTDWEKLSELRPDVIVIEMNEANVPQGLRDRAGAIGAKLVNLKLASLDDLDRIIVQLGEIINETAKAKTAKDRFDAQLRNVKDAVGDRAAVSTLLVLDDSAQSVIGPGGFLDTVLSLAGGRNAAAAMTSQYVSVDREKLVALNPEVVIALLPGSKTTAAEVAANLPDIDAKKNQRVYVLNQWYLLIPGFHLADTAAEFARLLHN